MKLANPQEAFIHNNGAARKLDPTEGLSRDVKPLTREIQAAAYWAHRSPQVEGRCQMSLVALQVVQEINLYQRWGGIFGRSLKTPSGIFIS